MSKTLKKLTILLVVSLLAVGGTLGGLAVTADAQTADEDAIKAEVEATARQLAVALNTSDGDLFDSLWLQSDKTTRFNTSQPFRIEGWSDVRQAWAGILSLPPGAVHVVSRQGRVDLLGDDVAIWSGHFVITIRPPGGTRRTINGRFSRVLQKVGDKWLTVHHHTSALP